MTMPGRKYEAQSGYRYGFNGKEKDKDLNSLTAYDYGFRIYNPGIGKFLSVDPLTKDYPWFTPYQFAGNLPIWAIDIDGLEGDQKPNNSESKKQDDINSLAKKLDDNLAGGEVQNENNKSYLRSAMQAKNDEINSIKVQRNNTFEELRKSELFSPEATENLNKLDQYDNQIHQKQKEFSFLAQQLYLTLRKGENIENYNKWLETEIKLLNYSANAMFYAATFLPTGGASSGFFLSSTSIRNELFSLKGGYGLFGRNGWKIGSYKIEALYKTPNVGFGTGTFFSIKNVSVKSGGSFLRWDYGVLHGTETMGVHSTFRLNLFGKTFGSNAQRSWSAPFKFWKYQK